MSLILDNKFQPLAVGLKSRYIRSHHIKYHPETRFYLLDRIEVAIEFVSMLTNILNTRGVLVVPNSGISGRFSILI